MTRSKRSASNATWSQTPFHLWLYQQKNTLIPVDRHLARSYYPAPVWHLPSSQEHSSLCITKISWINKNLFFKQLKTAGFASHGWGNTKSLGWWIRRGDNIWQEDGEKMLEAATLSPYTARAMHTAKCLTFWDAEECFTRTRTAKQMKRVIHSKYSPCWLNKRGHYNKRLGIKSTESYSHTAALLWL